MRKGDMHADRSCLSKALSSSFSKVTKQMKKKWISRKKMDFAMHVAPQTTEWPAARCKKARALSDVFPFHSKMLFYFTRKSYKLKGRSRARTPITNGLLTKMIRMAQLHHQKSPSKHFLRDYFTLFHSKMYFLPYKGCSTDRSTQGTRGTATEQEEAAEAHQRHLCCCEAHCQAEEVKHASFHRP
jgi:hypothetical protein